MSYSPVSVNPTASLVFLDVEKMHLRATLCHQESPVDAECHCPSMAG